MPRGCISLIIYYLMGIAYRQSVGYSIIVDRQQDTCMDEKGELAVEP